jgi:hypothetical protein
MKKRTARVTMHSCGQEKMVCHEQRVAGEQCAHWLKL